MSFRRLVVIASWLIVVAGNANAQFRFTTSPLERGTGAFETILKYHRLQLISSLDDVKEHPERSLIICIGQSRFLQPRNPGEPSYGPDPFEKGQLRELIS